MREGLVLLRKYGFKARCLPSQLIKFIHYYDHVSQACKDGSYLLGFLIT